MSGFLRRGVCVVTGAGSGIGKGIASMMAQQGGRVAICDRSLDTALQAKEEIERGNIDGEVIAVEMDVTSESQVQNGYESICDQFKSKRVDVLIANAGIQHISPFEDFSLEDWQKMLNVHLNGSFLTAREAVRRMKIEENNRKGGNIIFMGSVHSKEASLCKSAYVTAKHGLMGLTRALAKEGGPDLIRTNLVCPGFVETPLVLKQIPEQAEKLKMSEEDIVSKVMLVNTVDKKFTTIEEVARVCCFLADSDSCSLTGQSITVSHGWNMS